MTPEIDCRDLFSRLGDEELLVIDCRTHEEWERFTLHIPGALHLSLPELDAWAQNLPDDELIVVCGFSDDGSDARRAQRLLTFRGRQALCLVGGLQGWVSESLPTERHLPASEPHWA